MADLIPPVPDSFKQVGVFQQPASENALTLATYLEEPEYLQELLARGVKPDSTVNKYHDTSLAVAVLYRRTNNIAILLKHGATLDWLNTVRKTPLNQAVGQNNFSVALFLYRLGADPTIKSVQDFSPIDTLRKYKDYGTPTRRDRAAYKKLIEELKKDRPLDTSDLSL